MMSLSQVVRVRREKIAACMICPICNKLLRDATTISECLHTFCRKCIFKKITEEDLDSCPVCNINLGCAPLDKLRADHSLQELRAKIFPSKKTKAKAVEAAPSVALPTRRKERSLSSLVVNTPRIPAQTGATGKRTKSAGKKVIASRELTFPIEEPIKPVEDHAGCTSSPETINKIAQNIVKEAKNLTIAELSKQHMPIKDKDSVEPCEGEADMWKPKKCPVEVLCKTKSSSLDPVVKLAACHVHDNEACVPKERVKFSEHNLKSHDYENDSSPVPASLVKPRKPKGDRQKRAAPSEILCSQAQAVVDASNECEQGFSSIWFSLVASSQQKGVAPLPQITSRYLRIKDGSIPVSYIKKYLVKKLDLISESEVEITLRGQPLPSTWQLHELIDLWLHTAPTSQRIQTTVGSSAKDVVMDAVDIVRHELRQHDDPQRCARELVDHALHLYSKDNLAAIVVCFTYLQLSGLDSFSEAKVKMLQPVGRGP